MEQTNKAFIDELNVRFKNAAPQELLSWVLTEYKGEIALSSSFSIEDQVLTDMICKIDPSTRIFTLDTGRLFPETYTLIEKTKQKYNIDIEIFFPNYTDVENMVNRHGINLFYKSVECRKLCCNVRKIEPLKRAFTGLKVWICGLRQEQSITRYGLKPIEWDGNNNLIKISPLAIWTEQDVWEYIRQNNVPYNELHDHGFPSIGCQPCTRAIKAGEDIRAGRWWWETPANKECGLPKRK